MLFLLLAILSSALVSIVMRQSEKYIGNSLGLLAVNYMVCSMLALGFAGFDPVPRGEGAVTDTLLGIGCGVLFLVSFIMMQRSVSRNGVILSSAFMKLGVLVPTVMSAVFLGQVFTLPRLLGAALAVCAIVVMNPGAGALREHRGSLGGLVLLLLLGGCADGMSKIYEHFGTELNSQRFLLYTFAVALMLCLIPALKGGKRIGGAEIMCGIPLGVCNFFCSKFLLAALTGGVGAIVAYPTFSVGVIVAVTLMGIPLFGQRLSKRQMVGLALILGALVLLNV